MHTITQPTIWEVPDDVWTVIASIGIECDPPKPTGHRRVELRWVLHGIIFRLRRGCPWPQWPKPLGDDSTVHRHVQPWCQHGLMARLGAVLVEAWGAWGRVDWPRHAANAAMGNAQLEGEGVGRPHRRERKRLNHQHSDQPRPSCQRMVATPCPSSGGVSAGLDLSSRASRRGSTGAHGGYGGP
jgi:transposase